MRPRMFCDICSNCACIPSRTWVISELATARTKVPNYLLLNFLSARIAHSATTEKNGVLKLSKMKMTNFFSRQEITSMPLIACRSVRRQLVTISNMITSTVPFNVGTSCGSIGYIRRKQLPCLQVQSNESLL